MGVACEVGNGRSLIASTSGYAVVGFSKKFPNLLKKSHAAAPDAAIHAVYGLTEAEPIAHIRFDHIGHADWSAMAGGAGLLGGDPGSDDRVSGMGRSWCPAHT